MKMKILSILLGSVMVLGMSLTAYADETEYNLWVGGTQVTSANATDTTSHPEWSYEATTKTLTLNGANISARSNDSAAILSSEDLTINVTADSTVSRPDGYGSSFGIRVVGYWSNLTIKGSGTLKAIGKDAHDFSSGVYVDGGVTVGKGTTLIAIGGMTTKINGWSNGVGARSVTFEEGGTLTATGNKQAIDGIVKNLITGMGWMNMEGTGDQMPIEISSDGQKISEQYKKVYFHGHDFTYFANGAVMT